MSEGGWKLEEIWSSLPSVESIEAAQNFPQGFKCPYIAEYGSFPDKGIWLSCWLISEDGLDNEKFRG